MLFLKKLKTVETVPKTIKSRNNTQNLNPNSPSAKILGKEIWFKIDGTFVKQEEEFDSIEEVEEIIRLLEQNNPNFSISEQKPQGELDLPDGTRITLTIPPRTLYPTIVFRRFIFQ